MKFKKLKLFVTIFVILQFLVTASSIQVLNSFQQLGKHHCKVFSVELLWRVASGTLSEAYGEQFFDYDCYIRQFVREDGLGLEEGEGGEGEDQDQDENKQDIPNIDPLVEEYAKGLKDCLPKNVDSVAASYQIWRFVRFVVQHDYAYEWMRAKVRAGLGYQSQRPNAWMDGQNGAERLRLDKLFSNQFYEYVDKLMFKDFLYPIMTFLKRNTVVAFNGVLTASKKPLIVQSVEGRNILPQIFFPVALNINGQSLFTYTIPGIPLLLAGSSQSVVWAFTGVLLDRSNVQQIETVGNKFYHHDTEEWIQLRSENITIPGVHEKTCSFLHSAYGTLYTKQNLEGKVSEYIAKWHQKQSKVRVVFHEVFDIIKGGGHDPKIKSMQFPFNSLVLANATGIFQYICPQFYPSYFLYADMFGEPEQFPERWISYAKRKYVAISNSLLTTMKQESYFTGEALSSQQQQIAINIRNQKSLYTPSSAIDFVKSTHATGHIKKLKDMMLMIYRKVKFVYLPDEKIRKQCDQLINMVEKWNGDMKDSKLAPIYILWDYYVKEYTFNHVSSSEYGLAIVKHKIVSDNYWVNQMALWQKGTSYGECDSNQYEAIKHEVNGTGQNSSCYFNIIRGINKTREILFEKYENPSDIKLEDFTTKQLLNLAEAYKGNSTQEAFGAYYSRHLFFSAEVGNSEIIYHRTYKEVEELFDLNTMNTMKGGEKDTKNTEALDDDL